MHMGISSVTRVSFFCILSCFKCYSLNKSWTISFFFHTYMANSQGFPLVVTKELSVKICDHGTRAKKRYSRYKKRTWQNLTQL